MAAAAPVAAEQAADLMQKMSLEPKSKGSEAPESQEKPTGVLGTAVNAAVAPASSTELPNSAALHEYKDNGAYYRSVGYPTATYYYGGYGGWENYSTYIDREGAKSPSTGVYGDMYQQLYGYGHYSPYPSPTSPVPGVGYDGQLYSPQHYQFPTSYYQPQTPSNQTYPAKQPPLQKPVSTQATSDQTPVPVDSNKASSDGVDGIKGVKNGLVPPLKPSQQMPSNGSYTRPPVRPPSYQNQRVNFEGNRPSIQLPNSQSERQQKNAVSNPTSTSLNAKNRIQSKNYNARPLPHLMGLHSPTSAISPNIGIMNSMYNGMYGPSGNAYRQNYWFGSNAYGSGLNSGWGPLLDGKYKLRGRGYGSYSSNPFPTHSVDGLNELKRGPRIGVSRNTNSSGSTTDTANGPESSVESKDSNSIIKEQCNRADFPDTYPDAKFFIIKSYSEDDIHKSIKYNVWASTPNGNKKLDAAYVEATERSKACPVFLFFSVNTSGQFVGVAEMTGRVDFNKTLEYWQQDKWLGCFPVKWHVVKDVPNNLLKHIILENNENKPVTNSRDTQEVKLEHGLEMLKIFKNHTYKTSIMDDFSFYDNREKVMQERKSKQQQLIRKVADAKLAVPYVPENAEAIGKPRIQKPVEQNAVSKEPAQVGAAVEPVDAKENGEISPFSLSNGIAAEESKSAGSEKAAIVNDLANGH